MTTKIIITIFYLIAYQLCYCQITFTPKVGLQFTGVSSFPKGVKHDKDIRIFAPYLGMSGGVELGMTKNNFRYSLQGEINELGYGVIIRNSFIEKPGITLPSFNTVRTYTSHNHIVLTLLLDKINNFFSGSKRFSYWYGAGAGIGFSHPEQWWVTRQYVIDEPRDYIYPNHELRFRVVTKFKGKGYYLKARGGISFHDKKGNEIVIIDIFYAKGLKKMIEYDLDYKYGYYNLPQYQKEVKGLRFVNRGTYFGAFLGFPLTISNPKSKRTVATNKTPDNSSSISIIPKIGSEFNNIGHFENNNAAPNDLKIGPPSNNFLLGTEIAYQKGKNKLSLGIELQNLGKGVTVINDSIPYINFTGSDVLRCIGNDKNISIAASYERHYNFIGKQKKISFFYGAGLAVAFNRSKDYYKNKPGVSYVSSQSNWDNNFFFIEIFTKSKGVGYFVKLKSGFALHNKKGREKILLEFFYNQGLKKMQEHSVNYLYYTTIPGNGNSGSGIRFNNRGSTFGTTLGFPVYFFKSKKSK